MENDGINQQVQNYVILGQVVERIVSHLVRYASLTIILDKGVQNGLLRGFAVAASEVVRLHLFQYSVLGDGVV